MVGRVITSRKKKKTPPPSPSGGAKCPSFPENGDDGEKLTKMQENHPRPFRKQRSAEEAFTSCRLVRRFRGYVSR